ncbi:hypothetical protein LTR17_016564 [Elasticomyces elasticus]|nr:hypothetical protein LTR17_016564 [Elasticomyces elasticus]
MSDKLVLYDLANKLDAAWNPNVWKTRAALNYKGIPYDTEWVEYPDVAPKFKALGIPANPEGAFADYTCPCIRLPDGTFIMDSNPIAEKLESLYPEPSMRMENGLWKEMAVVCDGLVFSAGPDFLCPLVNDILREPAGAWFSEDRHKRFGATLPDIEVGMGGEKCWEASKPGLEKLKALLTTHKEDEGPFILGSKPSYGDLIAAGLFASLKRMHAERAEKVMGFDESFVKVLKACEPWLKKVD